MKSFLGGKGELGELKEVKEEGGKETVIRDLVTVGQGLCSCACWVGFPEMLALSYSFHSGSGHLFLAGRRACCLDQSAAPFRPSLQHTHTHPLALTPVAQTSLQIPEP